MTQFQVKLLVMTAKLVLWLLKSQVHAFPFKEFEKTIDDVEHEAEIKRITDGMTEE